MREKTKQIMKKLMVILLTITVTGSALMWTGTSVYASMADDAIEYTMGETYRGDGYYRIYYRFVLNQKSRVSLNVEVATSSNKPKFTIYDTAGKKYVIPGNVAYYNNNVSGISTGVAARTLKAGIYYLEINREGSEFYFNLQTEDTITLSKGSITSLKSSKSGQMTVSCQNVTNALGYRIQYSTDYRFKKGVKTVYSPTKVKTLTNLSRGKRYYVKVTPYTVYSDGSYAWGGTSYVKTVVVK